MNWLQRAGTIGFVASLLFFFCTSASAQLSLDVEIDETLSNSQSINVQSLLTNSGQGPMLFRMFLENENTSEFANDLYLRIIVRSDKIGRIVDIRQLSNRPFSLDPGQQVFATNNNIGDGLPGVEELIEFEGELTPEGEDFLNDLRGSTSLPADNYQITVEVYRGSVGEELLASQSAEIGTNIVEDTRDFYLISPGDVVGSDASTSNTYPNFQWQGSNQTAYRLVVVESRADDSPQSLMDGAMSTEPVRQDGSGGGSLVDYEMLDVIINQSSFQYPSTGVQNLQPGKKYYWRIVSQLETGDGVESRESEIWSFSITDNRSRTAQQSGEVTRALQNVMGDQFQQLVEDDFSFQSIVIDGEVYQGGQALQKLLELGRRAERGDVSIVIEEQ